MIILLNLWAISPQIAIQYPCQQNQVLNYSESKIFCQQCNSSSKNDGLKCSCGVGQTPRNQFKITQCNPSENCDDLILISQANGIYNTSCNNCSGIYQQGICKSCQLNGSSLNNICTYNSAGRQLSQDQFGCQNNDPYSCSSLSNLCSFSKGTDKLCDFKSQFSPFVNYENYFRAQNLKLRLFKFHFNGSILWQQNLAYSIGQINVCGSRQFSTILGQSFYTKCKYNYSKAIQQSYTYQIKVQNISNDWVNIPVVFQKNVTRFFKYNNQMHLKKLSIFLPLKQNTIQHPYIKVQHAKSQQIIQNFQFQILYYSNTNQLDTAINIMISIFSALALLISIGAAYTWNKANPQSFLGEDWAGTMLQYFIYRLLQSWSLLIYFVLFILSTVSYFTTKFSNNPIHLISQQIDTKYLIVGGIAGFCGQIVIWMRYAKISSTQIFLIDWQQNGQKKSWRHFFVYQQFIRVCFQINYSKIWLFLWTIFLLQGINVQDWAQGDTRTAKGQGKISIILLFFLGACCITGTGLTMKLLRRILSTWWPYRYEQFLDICTVANCSILLVPGTTCQAYYIQAHNIGGSSQSSIKIINEFLQQQNRLMARRGMKSDDCQTFTFYLTKDLTDTIRTIRREEATNTNNKLKLRSIFINNYFKILARALIYQHKNQIKQANYTQLCFGLPPIQVSQLAKVPVLISDPLTQFSVIFPSGNQISLVFLAILMLQKSAGFAAALTALLQIIGLWIGKRRLIKNISSQTSCNPGFIDQ